MTDIVERLRNPIMRAETAVDGHYVSTIAPTRAVVDPEDAERVRLAAAAEIERLQAENFSLAACQCSNPIALENGDWECGEIRKLREALRPFARRAQEAIDLNISYPEDHFPSLLRDCFAARTALGEAE